MISFANAAVGLFTVETALAEHVSADLQRQRECCVGATWLQLSVLHADDDQWFSRARDRLLSSVSWTTNLPGKPGKSMFSFLRWCCEELRIKCTLSPDVGRQFSGQHSCLVCEVRTASAPQVLLFMLTTGLVLRSLGGYQVTRVGQLRQRYGLAAYMWYNTRARRFVSTRVTHARVDTADVMAVGADACVVTMYRQGMPDVVEIVTRKRARAWLEHTGRPSALADQRRRNPFSTERSDNLPRSYVLQLLFQTGGDEELVKGMVAGDVDAMKQAYRNSWTQAEDKIVKVRLK